MFTIIWLLIDSVMCWFEDDRLWGSIVEDLLTLDEDAGKTGPISADAGKSDPITADAGKADVIIADTGKLEPAVADSDGSRILQMLQTSPKQG